MQKYIQFISLSCDTIPTYHFNFLISDDEKMDSDDIAHDHMKKEERH